MVDETRSPETPEAKASRPEDPQAPAATAETLADRLGVDPEGGTDTELDASIRALSEDLSDIGDLISEEMSPRGGRMATLVMLLCLVGLVAGVVVLLANPKSRHDLECFFGGRIRECKMAVQLAKEAALRERDYLEKNKYGQVELVYSPADSRVDIKILKYVESEDAFIARLKRGLDARGGPAVTCSIDNESHHLKEGQTVKKISLPSLPIQEKLDAPGEGSKFVAGCTCTGDAQCGANTVCRAPKEGHEGRVCVPAGDEPDTRARPAQPEGEPVIQMASYRYEITISREGYEPRKLIFSQDPLSNLPKDVRLLTWEQFGPTTFIINFPGADLVPKPETAKENVQKALIDLKCELPKVSDPEDREILESQIRLRHQFKTRADWERITKALQENDPEWWKANQEDLKKVRCP